MRDCERSVEDRKETLAFVKRQKLLKPPLGPVPILAEPSAVKKFGGLEKFSGTSSRISGNG
ncbi:MAG: hypothetical protein DME47_08150 [Verrucomicrobia bacterium]|nr:MAG: hypothetical protein DME47_08150 [Verrucomicrobiota bacterium]